MSSPTYKVSVTSARSGPLDCEDLHLLSLLASGLPVKSIARRLHLSTRTVRRRCRAVCTKLGVETVIEAVAWAARQRLI